jgi:hypothetical protein
MIADVTLADKLIDRRLGNTVTYYLSPREDINMRVPDEIRQCVVFVGLPEIRNGQQIISFKGTAFFVSFPTDVIPGAHYLYLVTARHVAVALEGKPFLVRVNTKDGKSELIRGEGVKWWYHPIDSSIDVAVISWLPPQQVEYKSIPVSMFLSEEIIRSKSIGTGDEVFITGLFAHLVGSSRNLPIVRMGNIAMMPGEPVASKELGNIEAYLIEARSIGGLSGSPAFVRETSTLGGVGSFWLLGLMHGHWDIPADTKNDQLLTDSDKNGQVNMGIAIVIPAKKILEVLNQQLLIENRKKNDENWRRQNTPTLDEHVKSLEQKQETPKQDSVEEDGITREQLYKILDKASQPIKPESDSKKSET